MIEESDESQPDKDLLLESLLTADFSIILEDEGLVDPEDDIDFKKFV